MGCDVLSMQVAPPQPQGLFGSMFVKAKQAQQQVQQVVDEEEEEEDEEEEEQVRGSAAPCPMPCTAILALCQSDTFEAAAVMHADHVRLLACHNAPCAW